MTLLLLFRNTVIPPSPGAEYSNDLNLIEGHLYIHTMQHQTRATYSAGASRLRRVEYKPEVER